VRFIDLGIIIGFKLKKIHPSGVPPPFSDPEFDNSFSESFMNFAMNLDTNVKHDPTNITPLWPLWAGSNEMLFNKTEAGAAIVQVVKTSTALLNRCK